MIQSLDHVLIATSNLDAATSSYARLLGRTPSWRGEHPAAGTANSLFRLDNTYLELLAPAGDGELGQQLTSWLEARGEGPLGLAFGTDDIEACHTALTDRGLEPAPTEAGLGRDVESGAYRRWQRVSLPLSTTRGVLMFAIEHTTPAEILPLAPAMEEANATLHALDHAVIMTPDADAAKALYGDGLGLRLALDKEFPQWGARQLFFRVGGVTVELGARLSDPDPGQDTASDRLWGLAYQTRDIEATAARLERMGFDASEIRDGRKPGTRVLSVRDGTCGVPTLVLEHDA
ncbi:VOC family protein [Myxococcota bacterium]|nr:VOC family protein [Myxococcota bacterium]